MFITVSNRKTEEAIKQPLIKEIQEKLNLITKTSIFFTLHDDHNKLNFTSCGNTQVHNMLLCILNIYFRQFPQVGFIGFGCFYNPNGGGYIQIEKKEVFLSFLTKLDNSIISLTDIKVNLDIE